MTKEAQQKHAVFLHRSAKYRKGVIKVSDARISLIGEIIDGIKTVKLNSLDHGFKAKVELLRAKELASIRRALTLNAYNQARARWGAKESLVCKRIFAEACIAHNLN